jgi:hypothetical protein
MLTFASDLARTARLYGGRSAVLAARCRATWFEFTDRAARAGFEAGRRQTRGDGRL